LQTELDRLRQQAMKYRRLAGSITHAATVKLLLTLAAETDAKIDGILRRLNQLR
jgi:hypothetical protein